VDAGRDHARLPAGALAVHVPAHAVVIVAQLGEGHLLVVGRVGRRVSCFVERLIRVISCEERCDCQTHTSTTTKTTKTTDLRVLELLLVQQELHHARAHAGHLVIQTSKEEEEEDEGRRSEGDPSNQT